MCFKTTYLANICKTLCWFALERAELPKLIAAQKDMILSKTPVGLILLCTQMQAIKVTRIILFSQILPLITLLGTIPFRIFGWFQKQMSTLLD